MYASRQSARPSTEKCTYLDARSILINVIKCPAKSHLLVTLKLAFVFGLSFRLGYGLVLICPLEENG